MNISDIEAFLAIIETRNLSKAADMLFVTQSTISHRLNTLERELNLQLVERSRGSRFVELTPKGEELIPIAHRWVTLWKETQQLHEQKAYTKLTIAQVDWFAAYPFFELYDGLIQQEPSFKLDLQTGHSLAIFSMVNNMTADIGFVVRTVASNTITCTPLFRDPLVLVSSREARLPKGPVDPRILDVQNEVFWGYFGDYRIWHDQWWDPNMIPTIEADFSAPMSFDLLQNRARWLVSPRSVAESMLPTHPDLAIWHFTSPPPDLTVYMLQRNMPRPNVAVAAETFSSYVTSHIDVLTAGRSYMKL